MPHFLQPHAKGWETTESPGNHRGFSHLRSTPIIFVILSGAKNPAFVCTTTTNTSGKAL